MANTEADAPNHSEVLLGNQCEHPKVLLQKLQTFYCDKSMCDVTLKAGSYSVPAHKVVLAASSDYFTAMFTGNWAEKHDDAITLHDLTPTRLKAMVEFCYHGKLTVDIGAMDTNPSEILDGACSQHPQDLVKKLLSYYTDKAMCDVTLKTGGYSVDAHRVVLAASSDYFTAMFTGNWAEKHDNAITLHELTPTGLEAVVEFCYHGKLTVDYEKIGEILSAVHHCQLVKAFTSCEDYLRKKIEKSNFADLVELSTLFNLASLETDLVNFSRKFLLPKYFEDADSALDEIEASFFKRILKNWEFFECGFGQIATIDLVLKWTKKNKRRHDLHDLLTAVCRNSCNVDEALKFCQMTPRKRILETNSSGSGLVCCGFDHHMSSGKDRFWTFDIISYNVEGNSWRKLASCLTSCFWEGSFGTTVLNGVLYVCGGGWKNDTTTSVHHKYVPWLDRWVEIPPLQTACEDFPLVAFEGKLFALGGLTLSRGSTASVEIYDPIMNKWVEGVQMPKAILRHAATTHGGKIYLSGGQENATTSALDELYCYDPSGRGWEQKTSMICGRFGHNFVTLGSCLYQCGGWYTSIDNDLDEDDIELDGSQFINKLRVKDPFAEYYDVMTNTWTGLDILNNISLNERKTFGLCPLNGALYFLSKIDSFKSLEPPGYCSHFVLLKVDVEKNSVSKCFVSDAYLNTGLMLLSLNIPSVVFDQFNTRFLALDPGAEGHSILDADLAQRLVETNVSDVEAMDTNPSEILDGACSQHPQDLVKKLQSYYTDKAMCDITLKTGGYSVDAHKVVLAASSDYFTAMFTGNWAEKHDNTITLHELTPTGLKAVVEFCYHGKLTVDYEKIGEILSAVHHCQLVKAFTSCEDYLRKKIEKSNFADLVELSTLFNLASLETDLVNFAQRFLLPKYFEDADSALDDIEASFFERILKNWEFSKCGFGQIAAVDLVFKWTKKNQRKHDLHDLLTAVCRNSCNVDEALKFCQMTPRKRILETNSTGSGLVCCTFDYRVPTWGDMSWTFDFISYNVEGNSWRKLPPCPTTCSWVDTIGTTVLNGVLYVCGGRWNDTTTSVCHKYEPWLDRWVEVPPLQTARERFSLVAFENKLVALGGWLQSGETTASVEIYDPITNKWLEGVPIPRAVLGHAATTQGGKIYLSGGQENGLTQALDALYCYDPSRRGWEQKINMICGRFEHNFVTLGSCLYQCGGFDIDDDRDEDDIDLDGARYFSRLIVDEPFAEYYDVLTNTWTGLDILNKLPRSPLDTFGLCPLNGALYIFARKYSCKFGESLVLFKVDLEKNSVSKCFVSDGVLNTGVMLLSLNIASKVFDQFNTEFLALDPGTVGWNFRDLARPLVE